MTNYAHIIPLGLEFDRTSFMLSRYPPFRIHFLDPDLIDEEYRTLAKGIQKKITDLWPVPEKQFHTVCCHDFEKMLLKIVEIMAIEDWFGNKVVPHVFSGSRIYAIALYVAACLTNQEIVYVRAKDYLPRGVDMITSGVVEDTFTTIQLFPIIFPQDYDCVILEFLTDYQVQQKHEGERMPWRGSRKELIKNLRPYLQKRKIRVPLAEEVKLSNCITNLREKKYITRADVQGKRQVELEITPIGRLMIGCRRTIERAKKQKQSHKWPK